MDKFSFTNQISRKSEKNSTVPAIEWGAKRLFLLQFAFQHFCHGQLLCCHLGVGTYTVFLCGKGTAVEFVCFCAGEESSQVPLTASHRWLL